ncbi:hypothetical protein CKAH01_16753 [Colletotrichum kahawae]|uniref:Uncharacterized protein n=1 Tax=Colletotrichum kahawae TaxID=34407 RepID=A0AAD9YCR8_COLKA|nr:hypothetical protein CKAH01_16753 [Colletotrichum kahawae]
MEIDDDAQGTAYEKKMDKDTGICDAGGDILMPDYQPQVTPDETPAEKEVAVVDVEGDTLMTDCQPTLKDTNSLLQGTESSVKHDIIAHKLTPDTSPRDVINMRGDEMDWVLTSVQQTKVLELVTMGDEVDPMGLDESTSAGESTKA